MVDSGRLELKVQEEPIYAGSTLQAQLCLLGVQGTTTVEIVLYGCEDNEFTIEATKEKYQSAHTICEIPFTLKMDTPTLSFEIMIPEWLP